SPDFWTQAAQQFQQTMTDSWSKAMQSMQGLEGGFPGMPSLPGVGQSAPDIKFAPEKLQALQQQYLQDAFALMSQGFGDHHLADKRFSDAAWATNPVAGYTAAVYLLNARTLMGLAEAVEADAKTRSRIRFAVEQWMAASAPSNMVHDLRQGHVSMTDESLFEVGKNVATTEGAVVFENEFLQLIEYKPLTPKVFERPFLMVPPCINKFYILDLQPENSLVRYAVSQGHRTFVVSWR
ncbi:MAG: class I poly(R)-hydroxyalkanoic acid synthase, partial [Burkholderiales bacterium PBB4]